MSVVVSSSLVIADVVSGGGIIDGNNPLIGYENLATAANLSATTENASNPADNLTNPATYLFWEGTAMSTNEYITMDLATGDDVDYVAVAKHNFSTAGITVSVEAFISSSWTEIVDQFIPPNDGPLLMRFTPQAIVSIRIRLQVGTVTPQAAVVYTGKLLILQRRIYVAHAPMLYSRAAQVSNGRSETGQFLGRIVKNQMTKTTVNMDNIMPDFFRTYLDPFFVAAKEQPFFWAWRPGDYPYEISYGWMTNDPQPINSKNNGMMKMSFDMSGIAI